MSLTTKFHYPGKFRRFQRHHGKPALANEANFLEGFLGLDLRKRDRCWQRFEWSQLDRHPAFFVGSRVGERGFADTGNANDAFFFDAMIKENFVADLHGLEVKAGGVIADASPRGAFVANEVVPRVSFGFGFNQPVLRCHKGECLVGCGMNELDPELEKKANRAQMILYGVMILFLILPFVLLWLKNRGVFG